MADVKTLVNNIYTYKLYKIISLVNVCTLTLLHPRLREEFAISVCNIYHPLPGAVPHHLFTYISGLA